MKATIKTKKPLKKITKITKTTKTSAKTCVKNSACRGAAIKTIKTASTKTPQRKTKRQEKAEKYAKVFGFSSRICVGAFIALTFIAVSHLVSAVNTVDVTTKNGIPTAWDIVTATSPDTLPAKITFFDQVQNCDVAADKYGFNNCDGSDSGIEQGMVKNQLGSDGLPVATANTDSFNRWFHAVSSESSKHEKDITFTHAGDTNKYTYGGMGIFPLDNVNSATNNTNGHNFYYTAHLSFPVRLSLSGKETLEFSGDDDAWVFINGQLVLDMGGIHVTTSGKFTVKSDGSVVSSVSGLVDKTVATALKSGDVVNIDIFYAERNGKGSDAMITTTEFTWPATAKSNLQALLVENKYIRYISSVTNTDPDHELTIDRLAAYHTDSVSKVAGFLPLSPDSLEFTYTPNDPKSWTHVLINDPTADLNGFKIEDNIKLGRAGSKTATAYFRFHVAPDHENVNYVDMVAYYATNSANVSGIAYGSAELSKSGINLNWSTTSGSVESSENTAVDMSDDSFNGNPDDYMPVYGETVFIPNADTLNEISAALFGSPFDAVAHNYVITMIILFVFAGSFAVTYGFRRYGKRGHFRSHASIIKK